MHLHSAVKGCGAYLKSKYKHRYTNRTYLQSSTREYEGRTRVLVATAMLSTQDSQKVSTTYVRMQCFVHRHFLLTQ